LCEESNIKGKADSGRETETEEKGWNRRRSMHSYIAELILLDCGRVENHARRRSERRRA
jgi:hypothetical protein